MAQAIVSGKPLAERALARRCRSIDGNDHVRSAPIERINSTKPGKLVAMNALSSMRTGLSRAKTHHQRSHRDTVIHMRLHLAATGRAALALNDQVVTFNLDRRHR